MSNIVEVIERHIERIPIGGCWIWTSALNESGYGQLTFKGRHMVAHRASLEAHKGQKFPENWILHRCDNRACVNPDHLYAGTPIDNRRDMLERSGWSHPYGKRKACTKGHPYTKDSYRIAKDGSRVCKECMRIHQQNYRSRTK